MRQSADATQLLARGNIDVKAMKTITVSNRLSYLTGQISNSRPTAH